jgi:hypothetical protein
VRVRIGFDTALCVASGPAGLVLIAALIVGCVYVLCPGAEQRRADAVNFVDTLIGDLGDGSSKVAPDSSDPNGNTGDPGGLNPNDPNDWRALRQAAEDSSRLKYIDPTGHCAEAYAKTLAGCGQYLQDHGWNLTLSDWKYDDMMPPSEIRPLLLLTLSTNKGMFGMLRVEVQCHGE